MYNMYNSNMYNMYNSNTYNSNTYIQEYTSRYIGNLCHVTTNNWSHDNIHVLYMLHNYT